MPADGHKSECLRRRAAEERLTEVGKGAFPPALRKRLVCMNPSSISALFRVPHCCATGGCCYAYFRLPCPASAHSSAAASSSGGGGAPRRSTSRRHFVFFFFFCFIIGFAGLC